MDQPEIKEAINVWYRDPKQVTEAAFEMYSFVSDRENTAGHRRLIQNDALGAGERRWNRQRAKRAR